jgi:glucan phosphoethanolaminetransferase (alkaline phosphatase superfamily)
MPCAFLAWYARYPHVSAAAVAKHLELATVAWVALSVARLTLALLVRRGRGVAIASAVLTAAMLLAVLAYYGLVIAGLHLWGRVISRELIESYFSQLPALGDALGFPVYALVCVAALIYLAFLRATWLYLRAFDWVLPLLRVHSRPLSVFVTVAAALFCAAKLYSFGIDPPVRLAEPVTLTLFAAKAVRNVQGHGIDPMRSFRLDAAEDAERQRYAATTGVDRKNVILVIVDGLRADRMSVYGYARDTTPHLSALDRAGMLRKLPEVRASCGSSSCGLLSLLGSKFVHEFSERPFSLYEVLRLYGYRVHLILGGDHTSFYDLKHLYGVVDTFFDASTRRDLYMNDDRAVVDRAAELPVWDGVPVLIQFHLMSAHSLGSRQLEFARFTPAASYFYARVRDRATVGNFYDNGVVQADAVTHQLLATLRAKGYLSNTLVVITADHGEALGERGHYGHPQALDEEVLRIPLLLMAEGYQPRALSRPGAGISQVDIAPTILAELGMQKPRTWSGFAVHEPIARDFTYLQELDTAGLVDHRDPQNVWKYRVNRITGEEQAINMSSDPVSQTNAIDRVPPLLKREWRSRYLQLLYGATERIVPNQPALPARF